MASKKQTFLKSVCTKMGSFVSSSEEGQPVSFDPTILMTIVPMFFDNLVKCIKARRGLDDSQVQAHVAARYANEKSRQDLLQEIKKSNKAHCREQIRIERAKARKLKQLPDVGKWMLDEEAHDRLAIHGAASFVALPPKDAVSVCSSL